HRCRVNRTRRIFRVSSSVCSVKRRSRGSYFADRNPIWFQGSLIAGSVESISSEVSAAPVMIVRGFPAVDVDGLVSKDAKQRLCLYYDNLLGLRNREPYGHLVRRYSAILSTGFKVLQSSSASLVENCDSLSTVKQLTEDFLSSHQVSSSSRPEKKVWAADFNMYDRREVYSFSSFWLSISIRCRIRDVLVKFINIVGPVGLWTFFFSFHAVFVEICKKVGLKVRRQPTATGTGVQKIDLLSMEENFVTIDMPK
ncbi:hypothetical protein D0Y65_046944, partial [Glycine soja]